jgi:hypothetical protein
MGNAMTTLALVLGVIVGLGVIIWVILFGILLFVDYERGMRMLGGLAMFVRSIRTKPAKERPHRHQREGDDEPTPHRRKTPVNPPTIRMFATPVPERRSGDKPKPKDSEPET